MEKETYSFKITHINEYKDIYQYEKSFKRIHKTKII